MATGIFYRGFRTAPMALPWDLEWQTITYGAYTDVEAVAWGSPRIDVIAKTATPNPRIHHFWYDGRWYGGTAADTDDLTGDTAHNTPYVIASDGKDLLDIFQFRVASGPRLDGAPYLNRRHYNPAQGWSSWDLDQYIFSGIEPDRKHPGLRVTSWGPRRFDWMTKGADGRVYHQWFHGDYPLERPKAIPSAVASNLRSVSSSVDRVVVLEAAGANGTQPRLCKYLNGMWRRWESLPAPGNKLVDIAVSVRDEDTVDVVVVGDDGRMWHMVGTE